MGKFIIMQDMRSMPSYGNVNARLVYMHVAMGVDVSTYTYATSLRRLAMELGMTVDTVRHALKVLDRDGLVTPQRTPQAAPQGTPQATPQRTPHLTILKINKNGTPNGTPNTTPNTTENPTENTTPNTIDKNNKIKNKNNSSPLTDARVAWADVGAGLMEALPVDEAMAASMVEEFRKRQRLKGKAWTDMGDLTAHVVAWAEKRLPLRHEAPSRGRGGDHEARMREYARTQEEKAAADASERTRDEVLKLQRWLREAKERGDTVQADELRKAIEGMLQKKINF